jgi:hypothetical protein
MPKYDYYINCQMLMSPLDEKLPYTAFVEYIYEVTGENSKRIEIDFGETKGETWKDAEKKMQKKVKSWISEQESHCEENHGTRIQR